MSSSGSNVSDGRLLMVWECTVGYMVLKRVDREISVGWAGCGWDGGVWFHVHGMNLYLYLISSVRDGETVLSPSGGLCLSLHTLLL